MNMKVAEQSQLKFFQNKEMRLILNYIINGHENLTPTLVEGHYSFQELEKFLEGRSVQPLLEELSEKGFLRKHLIDVELSCPSCGDQKLTDRYLCPFCESVELTRGTMIEHYLCGTVDFLEVYLKDRDLICPKCSKKLKMVGTDYRRIENVYRCLKCKRDFSVPNIVHNCIKCRSRFTFETTTFKPVYGYIFNEDLRNEVIANCAIETPLIYLLEEKGYVVSSPGILKGESGVDHVFDIVAKREDEVAAITIASTLEKVGPEAVISHFAKAFDVNPKNSIIVAIPSLSEDAKKLAKLYGIHFVEGKTSDEVKKGLDEIFKWKKGSGRKGSGNSKD